MTHGVILVSPSLVVSMLAIFWYAIPGIPSFWEGTLFCGPLLSVSPSCALVGESPPPLVFLSSGFCHIKTATLKRISSRTVFANEAAFRYSGDPRDKQLLFTRGSVLSEIRNFRSCFVNQFFFKWSYNGDIVFDRRMHFEHSWAQKMDMTL